MSFFKKLIEILRDCDLFHALVLPLTFLFFLVLLFVFMILTAKPRIDWVDLNKKIVETDGIQYKLVPIIPEEE